MRIDRIELTNFKNFDTLKATFKPGVNLFVGINGSGKTSLLQSICVAVGAFFGSQTQKMQRVINYDEISIINGRRASKTTVTSFSSYITLNWSRTIKSKTKKNDRQFIRFASIYGSRYFKEFDNPDSRIVAPLIAYYSSQRLFKDANQSKKQLFDPAIGRYNGYTQALEENAIKPLLMEWLGNAVTKRATLSIKGIPDIDNILPNVEQAIHDALIDFLELPENFPLKIYQEPDYANELYLVYNNEPPLPLTYYSDGFRNLLFLIIDLVWRASQLNPWLTLNEIKEQVTGVVLIDEVDLHLHPRWQAKAIPYLQELFPNVQFFITTHSPTVIANFSKGSLYVIDKKQINQCDEKYFGKEVNYILKNILGSPVRHAETQTKLDILFKMIDEEKPEAEFSDLLKELSDLIGKSDSEIQKALSLIEWNNYKKNNPDAVH